MKKQLISIFLFLFPLCYIEAKQKSPFRFENDTILHICSNFSEMDSWIYYMSDESERPYEYFIFPYWRFKNLVIDEGVDSVYFGLNLISAKRLSIPSSLKYLYFSEVPPSLEEVRLNAKNPCFRWEDGALYNQDKTCLYFMLPNAEDSVLQIPETVKQVWNIPVRYYPKDTLYLKDLLSRHWEGFLDRYPIDLRYSKIVFPKHCERYPEHLPSCDSLIIQSEHCPDWLEHGMNEVSYLYCFSDSAVAHIYALRNLRNGDFDREKIHCPNYDVSKRDTSWMRESYRLTCILENGDTLVGVDTISSERSIHSVKIEGIADENVRFVKQDDHYRFYVATYDTLYRLPLEVFVKPEEKKPELTWSDFGEVRDSVLIIREDVDSLPYLRGSFRKVIIPKRMHYLEGFIECDSAYLYCDSLKSDYNDVCDRIDARYYYVENEQLYLLIKRWLMKNERTAVVCCPHADVRKRNMALQQNTNKPVWKDMKGNVIKEFTYSHPIRSTSLRLEIEGMAPEDLYVYDTRRKRLLYKYNDDGCFILSSEARAVELAYAVWTYDTLLPLQQKDTVKLVKRDGTSWEVGYNWKENVLYYVPKGETRYSSLMSDKPVKMWRSGDTIPRRYVKRLVLGFLLENGECGFFSSSIKCNVLYLDKRNYLGEEDFVRDCSIWKIPRQYKKFWVKNIRTYPSDCIPRGYPSMHFYVGK